MDPESCPNPGRIKPHSAAYQTITLSMTPIVPAQPISEAPLFVGQLPGAAPQQTQPSSAMRAAASVEAFLASQPQKQLIRPAGPKPSANEIQFVQDCIEKCLQYYLDERQIILALYNSAAIEPGFAAIVLQKLQDQNPAYFKAYFARIELKQQVDAFNAELIKQAEQMQRFGMTPQTAPPSRRQQSPIPLVRPHSNSTPVLPSALTSERSTEDISMDTDLWPATGVIPGVSPSIL